MLISHSLHVWARLFVCLPFPATLLSALADYAYSSIYPCMLLSHDSLPLSPCLMLRCWLTALEYWYDTRLFAVGAYECSADSQMIVIVIDVEVVGLLNVNVNLSLLDWSVPNSWLTFSDWVAGICASAR